MPVKDRPGEEITALLGCKRRECPREWAAEWRKRNRDRYNATNRAYYHETIKKNPKQLARKLQRGSVARRKAKYRHGTGNGCPVDKTGS